MLLKILWLYLTGAKKDALRYLMIYREHFGEHCMELLAGAMPVFIAATFAEAVNSIIQLIVEPGPNNLDERINYSAIWALVVCQAVGYGVVYFLPKSLPSYNFWFRISVENCAFAFKEAMYLFIVYKIMHEYLPKGFFSIWLATSCICGVVVVLIGLLQELVTPPGNTLLKAKILNAEMYSLGIAYTFNIVTLAASCGPDFTSSVSTDDDHVVRNYNPICYPILVLYPLAVTTFLVFLHSLRVFDTAAELIEEGEQDEDEREHAELQQRHSEAMIMRPAAAAAAAPESPSAGHGHAHSVRFVSSDMREHEMGDDIEDLFAHAGVLLKQLCVPLDRLFCFWDANRTASTSLSMMLFVTLGLYCGSSWFIYALLQFRFVLVGGNDVYAYTLFSLLMTLMALVVLTRMSTVHARDVERGRVSRWSTVSRKRKELIFVAFRCAIVPSVV